MIVIMMLTTAKTGEVGMFCCYIVDTYPKVGCLR